jgi:hypothetical protein
MKLQQVKTSFVRVRDGMTRESIEKNYSVPVTGDLYTGRILCLNEEFEIYEVQVGDSYEKIAKKLNVEESTLKKLNNEKILYPSCKLFIPKNV